MVKKLKFFCELCPKKYVTKSGLTRHIKNKHATADSSSSSTSGSVANTVEEKLHLLHLKKYISKSVESLSQDEVYPEEDRIRQCKFRSKFPNLYVKS